MTEAEASEDVRIEDMNPTQPNKSCQPTPVGHVMAQRTSLWTGVAALCRSVKTRAAVMVLVCALVLGGCSDVSTTRLLGSWQSEVLPSEWGSNRLTMTFVADGRTYVRSEFLEEEGRSLHLRGNYKVHGTVIYHTVEGRTTKMQYRIDGDRMYLKMPEEETDCTLRRIITEPDGPANGSQPTRLDTKRASSAAGSRR